MDKPVIDMSFIRWPRKMVDMFSPSSSNGSAAFIIFSLQLSCLEFYLHDALLDKDDSKDNKCCGKPTVVYLLADACTSECMLILTSSDRGSMSTSMMSATTFAS
uniref:Uncharacterized protein n=1 Tax=Lygus hesperus TaxID=30085 RepID=A0A0A9XSP3_LYGHE